MSTISNNMKNIIFVVFLCSMAIFNITKCANAKSKPPEIRFEKLFKLKQINAKSKQLNNALDPEAQKLNQVWLDITQINSRKELKGKLDTIFKQMHAHTREISPAQENELWSREVEIRTAFFDLHYLIKEGLHLEHLNESIDRSLQ